jgi:hypothetical protein
LANDMNEVDEIRRQMAQIRLNLHNSVQQVVSGAGDVADWRRHIRAHPWLALGTAFTVGYLIVPKRRRHLPADTQRPIDVAMLRELIDDARRAGPLPEANEPARGSSLVGAAVGMLAPLAWRAAQSYALAYLEQWIAQQSQQALRPARAPAGAAAAPGETPARPRRPGT